MNILILFRYWYGLGFIVVGFDVVLVEIDIVVCFVEEELIEDRVLVLVVVLVEGWVLVFVIVFNVVFEGWVMGLVVVFVFW